MSENNVAHSSQVTSGQVQLQEHELRLKCRYKVQIKQDCSEEFAEPQGLSGTRPRCNPRPFVTKVGQNLVKQSRKSDRMVENSEIDL
jgi:hypothetical protein